MAAVPRRRRSTIDPTIGTRGETVLGVSIGADCARDTVADLFFLARSTIPR